MSRLFFCGKVQTLGSKLAAKLGRMTPEHNGAVLGMYVSNMTQNLLLQIRYDSQSMRAISVSAFRKAVS